MLLLVPLVFAGKFGATRPAPPSPDGGACNHTLVMSAEGLSACGKTATFVFPAKGVTDLLGPWSRTWRPDGEGVAVQKYVYDELGLTVREPSDGAGGSQPVMLELTCDETDVSGPFADKPFAGVVQVGDLRLGCSTKESEVLAMLKASGLPYSVTDWASYRIPLGEYEVAVGFPLEFQRPSPEADVPVSYIELRPLKK